MKRTALAGLFISAVMLASPVFAAEDLCQINLQKINDAVASSGEISSDLQDNIDSTVAQAKEEQKRLAGHSAHGEGSLEVIGLEC